MTVSYNAPIEFCLIEPRPIRSRQRSYRWVKKMLPVWMRIALGIIEP